MRCILAIILMTIASGSGEKKLESAAVVANYDGNRKEPINIKDDTKPFSTEASLARHGNGTNETGILINTGYSVEIQLSQDTTSLFLFGKALGDYLYAYTRTLFYWADEIDDAAGTIIKGESTPLEIDMLFYNMKYPSYFESLQKNDGIVSLRIEMTVDDGEDNKDYETFKTAMKQIQNPNSAEITIGSVISWFWKFPPSTYYVDSGSLKNQSDGTTYNCSIDIIVPKQDKLRISQNQFRETFLEIKNSNGKNMTTKEEAVPVGGRIIAKSAGAQFIEIGEEFKLENVRSIMGSPDS